MVDIKQITTPGIPNGQFLEKLAGSITGGTPTGALPTRYRQGLLMRNNGGFSQILSPGSARNSADTADMVLVNPLTMFLANYNIPTGTDGKTIGGSVTTTTGQFGVLGSGTAFLLEFAPNNTPRVFSGTATNSGFNATLGGSGLTSLAVNDMVGNAVQGYYRIISIESDFAATLASTPPSGLSGTAFVLENVTIQCGAQNCTRVNVITDNTNLTLATTATASAGGQSVAAGHVANTVGPASCLDAWVNVWLISGGSGVGANFSTQRTALLNPPSGYTTNARRISTMRVSSTPTVNATCGFYLQSQHEVSPFTIETFFEDDSSLTTIAGGSSSTWAPIILGSLVPPGAKIAFASIEAAISFSNPAYYISFRPRVSGTTILPPRRANQVFIANGPTGTSGTAGSQVVLVTDSAQGIEYLTSGQALSVINTMGYREVI